MVYWFPGYWFLAYLLLGSCYCITDYLKLVYTIEYMSSEEPDLPVAADVDTVADGVLNENDLHAVLRDEEIVEEGDELVKKSDAGEARQAERQKMHE